MSHLADEKLAEEKQKLLNRIRRIRGQIDAIERAVETEAGSTEVMRLMTAARGALNSAMAEVVEDHILLHMVDRTRKQSRAESAAADELIDVLRSYIK
jgi:DNA-binding FrmR family transcriptional regulator